MFMKHKHSFHLGKKGHKQEKACHRDAIPREDAPLLPGCDGLYYGDAWNYFNYTTGGFWFI